MLPESEIISKLRAELSDFTYCPITNTWEKPVAPGGFFSHLTLLASRDGGNNILKLRYHMGNGFLPEVYIYLDKYYLSVSLEVINDYSIELMVACVREAEK